MRPLCVLHGSLHLDPVRTRLPFRFGAATLRETGLLSLRLAAEDERGQGAVGCAADLLVPKWFDKDPAKSPEENQRDLIRSAEDALAEVLSGELPPLSLFDLWKWLLAARVEALPFGHPERLLRLFGVALVERALLDALARLEGLSILELLRRNALGFRPDQVHPQLAGWDWQAELPEALPPSLAVRHTVGMLDPLTAEDLGPGAPEDGLPRTLEEAVRAYGLRAFKIKVHGDPADDQRRLLDVASVLGDLLPLPPRITLDGNEQYTDLEALGRLLDGLETSPEGRWLLEGLAFVEQPLPRARSHDPAALAGLEAVAGRVPLVLDEADAGVAAFPRALALGWRGVSHKNCKSFLRSLLHLGLCRWFREERGGEAFLSGEDLTNLPLLPLQQDLAAAAVLGLPDVERNGHHFFRGLDHLPGPEQEEALRRHGDLYRPLPGGGAALRIEDGRVALGSLEVPGFASAVCPRWELHPSLGPGDPLAYP